MKVDHFRLIAAVCTPMHPDGCLNLAVVREQARRLVSSDIRGVFLAGTTGEGQSLTVDERMALTAAWIDCDSRAALQVFVHVGHNCRDDAVRLAQHANSLKVDAIAVHAATWWKTQRVDAMIEFCEPIAAAVPALPLYLYDIPEITGVTESASRFLSAAKARIPNLAGIKYTNADLATFQECTQMNDGVYDILWGSDPSLLAGIALGASGAVGSTYNFAAPLYQRILRAIAADDWQTARVEQARSVAMVRALLKFDLIAALKYTMSLVGLDCGPVRPPVRNLTPADQTALRLDLRQTGALRFPDNM